MSNKNDITVTYRRKKTKAKVTKDALINQDRNKVPASVYYPIVNNDHTNRYNFLRDFPNSLRDR